MKNLILVTGLEGIPKHSIISKMHYYYEIDSTIGIGLNTEDKFENFNSSISKDEFLDMILNEELEEWEFDNGNFHGFPKYQFETNDSLIIVTSLNLARKLKEKYNNSYIIFIGTNNIYELTKKINNNVFNDLDYIRITEYNNEAFKLAKENVIDSYYYVRFDETGQYDDESFGQIYFKIRNLIK